MGQKKQRGRPPKYKRPERINASPEEIAQVVLRAKPKKVWRFEEQAEAEGLQPRRP